MARTRDTLEIGQPVLNGRYKVVNIIANKGMSAVYLVEDAALKKKWCLKEIKKSNAGKGNVEYEALIQEANIMKTLDHVGIPRITTIEEEGDSLFIIMDYVDGMSMKAWLVQNGRISQDVTLLWMRQITQTMMYLHNRRNPIFYRDMKPDNVMIQTDGNLKLLDFGISMVLTGKDDVITKALGTKGYAAPEQSKRGMKCDLRSDIYAMGKTMYFMLTGVNPSQVKPGEEKRVREINPVVDEEIEAIVEKCCQEDPNKRYQTCEELLYDLHNCKPMNRERKRKMRKKVVLTFMLALMSIPMIYAFVKFRSLGYEDISWVLLAGGVGSFVASVICAIAFHVPSLLSELLGIKKKRQIEKLRSFGTGGLNKRDLMSDSEILAEGLTKVETPVSVKRETERRAEPKEVDTGRLDRKRKKPVDNDVDNVDNQMTGFVDADESMGVFMSSKRTVQMVSEQSSVR